MLGNDKHSKHLFVTLFHHFVGLSGTLRDSQGLSGTRRDSQGPGETIRDSQGPGETACSVFFVDKVATGTKHVFFTVNNAQTLQTRH